MTQYVVVVTDHDETLVCRSFENKWDAQWYANHVDEITGGNFWVKIVKTTGC